MFPTTYFDQIWPDLAKISQRWENRKDWSKELMELSLGPLLKEREIQIRKKFLNCDGHIFVQLQIL